MSDETSLIVDVVPGDRLSISSSESVIVELVQKSGQRARLRITAPRDVKITRESQNRTVHGSMNT